DAGLFYTAIVRMSMANSDFSWKRELSAPLTEEVRTVEMDPPLRAAYDELRQDLRSAVVHALHELYRGLLGSYITTLLAYLDHPAGFPPIRHPVENTIVAVPRSLPLDHLYAKDRELLQIIEE